jgi:hypothetical protein
MVHQLGFFVVAWETLRQAIKRQVDHRSREQGENLAHEQTTHDADAQWMPQL